MTQRILIIYTGGTIGMQPSPQGYIPVASIEDLLQEKLAQQNVSFDVLELEQAIDSSNLRLDDWKTLNEILKSQWQAYAGFVILHGTDTMAYTASALSFLLPHIDKPIILTGSQIPLLEARNDALSNLITALQLATYPIPEVCIYFHDRLLRGNRSRKLHSTRFDAFGSPNFPHLADIGIQLELHATHLLPAKKPCFISPNFSQIEVCTLPIQPSISGALIDSLLNNPNLKALILQSYGVGNPPDANREFMHSLQRTIDQGIVVLNTTQCPEGSVHQGAYATGAALNNMGVIAGRDITPEAAFAKLCCLFAQELDIPTIRKKMTQSLAGEITIETSA